jgi:hypothetical protein
VPIEGNDLVTDSQAASAVNGGNTNGKVLTLGNWWVTVRWSAN